MSEGLGGEAASGWDLDSLAGALRLFSGGSVVGAVSYAAFFALGAIVLAAGCRDVLALVLMWVALPVILVLAMPFGHEVRLRFFLYALPVYLLLVACGLTAAMEWAASRFVRLRQPEASRSAGRVLAAALLLGLLGAAAISSLPAYYAESKQNWRDAVSLVRKLAEPGDLILVRHIYHQQGVLFYGRQGTGQAGDWSEENVQILPHDLTEAFPPDGEGSRWLVVPARESFRPGGTLEELIQPDYRLLPPVVFGPTAVPRDAKLISPTSFRPVAVVQAVRTDPPFIRFWGDDTTVGQGECTMLRWDTGNIRELYFDGEGVVGQGVRKVCPGTSTRYTLQVIHRDGTVEEQSIEVLVSAP